ncbi:MAG: NusA-like transcription termination signal-binding factor [Candidatus Diapherotrites archaeon]|nr:NusA-like transcription termination signal-binding factor [Candidatus Diapherotrites archaeon]
MKLTQQEIFYINKFDSFTGVAVKDCIVDDKTVAFLVKPEDVGKAIGSNGSKVKILSKHFGKKVEVFAMYERVEDFIINAFPGINFSSIEKNGKSLFARLSSDERRKFMEKMARFKRIKAFAERDYNIEEIRF